MRKNIIKQVTLLGFLAVLAVGCDKSFLEQSPYGSVNEALLSTSEKGADALLIAAYSNLDGFSGWDNGAPWEIGRAHV